MITPRTFDRFSPQTMLSWLCHRYGFGTYLHFIKGMLNRDTFLESQGVQDRLIDGIEETDAAIYVDTIISPSMASALAQSLQVPGVSGMENNTNLFEYIHRCVIDFFDLLRIHRFHQGQLPFQCGQHGCTALFPYITQRSARASP
jgi:hypothetical protein